MADVNSDQEVKDIASELTDYETYMTNLQWQVVQKEVALQPEPYIEPGNNLKCSFLEKILNKIKNG